MDRNEMDQYLVSIGGLENGFFTDREPIVDSGFFGVNQGWFPIIKSLIDDLIKLGWDKQITQVKEKFGGLRFYINSGSAEIHERILQAETESWYKQNLPELSPTSYFLPSSEIVIYWASGGIIAFLLFLSHMFIPFMMPYLRKNIWFMAFFIPAIFSFTFETHLEGQLPIFVYGFFAAWFWWLAWRERQGLET